MTQPVHPLITAMRSIEASQRREVIIGHVQVCREALDVLRETGTWTVKYAEPGQHEEVCTRILDVCATVASLATATVVVEQPDE